MENDFENKKESNSEMIPFDISELSKPQYIKLIYMDAYGELCEVRAEDYIINRDTIQLRLSSDSEINIICPIGVVLKFVKNDAIYFAKTILQYVKNSNDKYIFLLKTPKTTMRQQNRKTDRVNISRPCVLLINDNKGQSKTYIAQSLNISTGGVLLCDVESLLSYKQIELDPAEGDSCRIAIFLRHDLRLKTNAKFVRAESIDEAIRYAFQFVNMPTTYIETLDTYLTKEKLKSLNLIKSD